MKVGHLTHSRPIWKHCEGQRSRTQDHATWWHKNIKFMP